MFFPSCAKVHKKYVWILPQTPDNKQPVLLLPVPLLQPLYVVLISDKASVETVFGQCLPCCIDVDMSLLAPHRRAQHQRLSKNALNL